MQFDLLIILQIREAISYKIRGINHYNITDCLQLNMTTKIDQGNIYFFGSSNSYTEFPSVFEIGCKAMYLMRMDKIMLPVPPGFVISTYICHKYLRNNQILPANFADGVEFFIKKIEDISGLSFDSSRKPLLLSVRSGAAVSMPGMLESILNVGLCDSTIDGLIRMTGNPKFVWDSYRRLIETYAKVVHSCPPNFFENILKEDITNKGLRDVRELSAEDLKSLSRVYLKIFEEYVHAPFPQQPLVQLMGAIGAVFRSWDSPRAIEYRRLHDIRDLIGTAVIIQAMVFGNMGSTSGSGVAFTRDPATGKDNLYIDFMFNSQGEDIVSGRHTIRNTEKLRQIMPKVYKEIQNIKSRLEIEFKDMQDFEFTIQEGKLFILQSRAGKRTSWAAVQIAVDLVNEGLIDFATALKRVEKYDLNKIMRMCLSSPSNLKVLCKGISANRGVAIGQIVLDSEIATNKATHGEPLVLVRQDISTDDIAGIAVCSGLVTNQGGRTSHAAVVARQMDKVCIVGCRAISIDLKERSCIINKNILHEGDYVTLDGNTGLVYGGKVNLIIERPIEIIEEIERWKKMSESHDFNNLISS
ncbi:MAG: PEP/pyruvate-binding domain-containing protein [Nitrososphaeraceae archaeon]